MLELGHVGRYNQKRDPLGTRSVVLSLRLHGLHGSAFDTIKVYIDCYRGAAAVSAGLLPGAVCVFYIVSHSISVLWATDVAEHSCGGTTQDCPQTSGEASLALWLGTGAFD